MAAQVLREVKYRKENLVPNATLTSTSCNNPDIAQLAYYETPYVEQNEIPIKKEPLY
jgi:hypothetical protein